MAAVTAQESGGRRDAIGPQTPYGRAQSSGQMLPATAHGQAAKLGLPWRPDLLTGTSDQAARYQQALQAGYLPEGITRTGSLRDGLRYYHGGPDRRLWGPRTNAYADAVLGRING